MRCWNVNLYRLDIFSTHSTTIARSKKKRFSFIEREREREICMNRNKCMNAGGGGAKHHIGALLHINVMLIHRLDVAAVAAEEEEHTSNTGGGGGNA